ncbi:MAG: hypothetical protein H0X03_01660 [Nitrosopumilus sp.]|nr:hypothetical protein [Nitrosopumilus sp.]
MSMFNNRFITIPSMIAIAISLLILIQVTIVDTANALSRYINCVTKVANNNGTVSMSNIENCYDKVFKGANDADDFGIPLK